MQCWVRIHLLWLILPSSVLSFLSLVKNHHCPPALVVIPAQRRCAQHEVMLLREYGHRNRNRRVFNLPVQLSLYTYEQQPQPSAQDPEAMDRNGAQEKDHRSLLPPRLARNTRLPPGDAVVAKDTLLLQRFREKQQQLWLDLRGTALFPHEALRFIREQCQTNHHHNKDNQRREAAVLYHLIDGVLVSREMMDIIVAAPLPPAENDLDRGSFREPRMDEVGSDDDDDYPTLLYVTEHDLLVASVASTQQSIVVGRTEICCNAANQGEFNLMAAGETIMEQKQWLLLVDSLASSQRGATFESKNSIPQLIARLLQFLSTSSSLTLEEGDYEASSSGLLLPGSNRTTTKKARAKNTRNGPKRDPSLRSSPTGGVAISCTDRNSFMTMDAILAEFRSTRAIGTFTTASGLCVPQTVTSNRNDDDDDDDDASPHVLDYSTALILPLDLNAWKAALDARLMEEEDTAMEE